MHNDSMISLRLSDGLIQQAGTAAAGRGISRSELIRRAVIKFLEASE